MPILDQSDLRGRFAAEVVASIPMGRSGVPKENGCLTAYLATGAGSVLGQDGGTLLRRASLDR